MTFQSKATVTHQIRLQTENEALKNVLNHKKIAYDWTDVSGELESKTPMWVAQILIDDNIVQIGFDRYGFTVDTMEGELVLSKDQFPLSQVSLEEVVEYLNWKFNA